MDWIRPGDATYDEKRALYNTMIDKRPAVIAACATASDVSTALERARNDDLAIAIRSGGHSVAGMSTNDDGIVIDVRGLKAIDVDPVARTARVGGGVTWAELDAAAQAHGLAVTGGRASTTGVSGFTLNGGSGWLERSLGLACDNLRAVELVTVDGREVRADATQNTDLLWASRGGGGNFGVVTALEFDLHPVGPEVVAGLLMWPADAAADITRAYRDWAAGAPDELGSGVVIINAPPAPFVPEHLQMQPVVGVAVCWNGDHADGTDYTAALRELAPVVDIVGPMPYADFNAMLDNPPEMRMREYWSAEHHDDLPDVALDIWVKYGESRPSETTQQLMLPWGGAVERRAGESALANRQTQWVSHPFASWLDPAQDEEHRAWVKGFGTDIAPYTNRGIYLNFIGDEGPDRVVAAFGAENYRRLQQVKAEYDPSNLLRGNQNIVPA